MSTSIIGSKFALPFFICPAGGGKLAHAQGEVLMTKAAAKQGALHWVCNMAGCSQQEMANIRAPNQTLFWQIYAMQDLAKTEREIRQAVVLGYKGFALTVDAIRAGKRERDMRVGIEELEVSMHALGHTTRSYLPSYARHSRIPKKQTRRPARTAAVAASQRSERKPIPVQSVSFHSCQ